jgi:hypothetical protein
MGKLTINNDHPVLSFAGEEWNRLLAASGTVVENFPKEVWIGTWGELKTWQPQFLEEHNGFEWKESGYSDEFVIMEMKAQVILSGKSERAALYAVYQYAREVWGLNAIYPGEAMCKDADVHQPFTGDSGTHLEPIRWYAPRMERRGFVFETINDPPYLIQMLDWFAHNKINEIFFTFTLWDQVGNEIASEISKRGIMVTLGGHSMKFFMNKGESSLPNTATAVDHPYTAKTQLNYRDSEWQAALLQDIVQYCREVPSLTRISLWPEDIADRQTDDFLAHYLRFTEQLRSCLHEGGLPIAVEHIAYNAGLAWNMLELSGAKPSSDVDTLYAYWGRDYEYGYEDSPHESDQRAKAAIENWTRELAPTGRSLTVFEYYSDHYMLTNLFPFIPERIMKDVAYYENQNVYGMVNLVVPYRGPDPYPWKWVHGFNSYVFSRALWSDDLGEILHDYYTHYPENERASVQALFEVIEAKLPAMTAWNIPLFPARVVDPEKAPASREQEETVLAALEDIKQSIQNVLQEHAELKEGSMPYLYAQHLIAYSEALYQRWLQRGEVVNS